MRKEVTKWEHGGASLRPFSGFLRWTLSSLPVTFTDF